MTLQPADLDRLEQLAREAREQQYGDGWLNVPFLMAFIDNDDETVMDPADAELIAALDPAVVSELVAAAREYRRFFEFVAITDPAIVDAWRFTENARKAASR